jgi:GDPmannose 4,6-dehydratase|tara:strand:+ start:1668 stop:2678 length:1011 start_codon:yes stop_codon:yes gene_type:complete
LTNALITGITGQDGAYLAKLLLDKGYNVFGGYRRSSSVNFWRLNYLNIADKINFVPMDMLDSPSLLSALEISNPSEVYNLAAQSFVGLSFSQPLNTSNVTGIGVVRLLESIQKFNPKIKFYQASSSEMYGNIKSKIKNEQTPFSPTSPYAISKVYAFYATKMYRETHSLYTVNGILFNHESPLRGLEFVTRKITNEIAKISLGLSKKLVLGNLESKRDWGHAQEYVEMMWKMLKQKNSDDYVLATGESHSVKEFVETACKEAGVSKNCVVSHKKYLRSSDVNNLVGDSSKSKKILGWKPKITFSKLVKIMIEEDIQRWEKFLKKEYFPWDADSSIR